MRQLIGVGTPRGLQGRLVAVMATLLALTRELWDRLTSHRCPEPHRSLLKRQRIDLRPAGKQAPASGRNSLIH